VAHHTCDYSPCFCRRSPISPHDHASHRLGRFKTAVFAVVAPAASPPVRTLAPAATASQESNNQEVIR